MYDLFDMYVFSEELLQQFIRSVLLREGILHAVWLLIFGSMFIYGYRTSRSTLHLRCKQLDSGRAVAEGTKLWRTHKLVISYVLACVGVVGIGTQITPIVTWLTAPTLGVAKTLLELI